MHSLEVIEARDVHAVIREFDEAVADGDHALARQIAKANPDLYTHDGRIRQYQFTPRLLATDERLEMRLGLVDHNRTGRGGPWQAEVTDLLTGQHWLAKGADCGLPCFCDATVTPRMIASSKGG